MATDSDSATSRVPIEEVGKDARPVPLVRCVLTGLGVGTAALPLCFLGSVLFFGLRDIGVFLLLALIPAGAICTWLGTRKYLAQATSPFRWILAFAGRYFFVGSRCRLFPGGLCL